MEYRQLCIILAGQTRTAREYCTDQAGDKPWTARCTQTEKLILESSSMSVFPPAGHYSLLTIPTWVMIRILSLTGTQITLQTIRTLPGSITVTVLKIQKSLKAMVIVHGG